MLETSSHCVRIFRIGLCDKAKHRGL